MNQMKVSLYARDSKRNPNIPMDSFTINNSQEDQVAFTIEKLEEEVKHLNKQDKKKLKKICTQTLTTSTSFFTLATPAFASTTNNPVPSIMPTDILTAGMWIIGMMAVAGFVLTIILLQSAAGYKMIFKKKKKVANDWSIEILRGFTQIMIAPALVVSIALVMYLLFGGLDWFINPLAKMQ